MKIAFCFAGQGAQAVGMGRDFYEKYESVKALYDAFAPAERFYLIHHLLTMRVKHPPTNGNSINLG